MNFRRLSLLAGLFLTLGITSASAAPAVVLAPVDPVAGYWRTQDGDGIIQLYACDNLICGKFYWLEKDSLDDISRDSKNKDPNKRDRPLCHMQFMGGFVPDAKGHYQDGWIYSPRSGDTYSAQMTLVDHGKLDLHGYVLTPLLGESQTWTRVTPQRSCVTAAP